MGASIARTYEALGLRHQALVPLPLVFCQCPVPSAKCLSPPYNVHRPDITDIVSPDEVEKPVVRGYGVAFQPAAPASQISTLAFVLRVDRDAPEVRGADAIDHLAVGTPARSGARSGRELGGLCAGCRGHPPDHGSP